MKKLENLGELHKNLANAYQEEADFSDLKERYFTRAEKFTTEKVFVDINRNLFKNPRHKNDYLIVRDQFARDFLKVATAWDYINESLIKAYENEPGKETMGVEDFGNLVDELFVFAKKMEIKRFRSIAEEKTTSRLALIKDTKKIISKLEKKSVIEKAKLLKKVQKKSFTEINCHFATIQND